MDETAPDIVKPGLSRPDLEGRSYAPLSCGKTVYLVVLLHGLGVDGDDLIDIAVNWQPSLLKAEFLAMHAPFPFDQGPTGRQWYSVADRSPEKIMEGLRKAEGILNQFLDESLAKRRLDDRHLALVGFSQGAMVALHTGLRRRKIGAIVSFSGALHGAELLPAEIRSRPPVLLIHGNEDQVVPYERMTEAKAALKALDVPVKSMTRKGLGHSIDEVGIAAVGDFLHDSLVPKKAAHDEHDDHDH
ncbi:alpha/beta hydrolase [Beijerinckia indica]|uniref:Phospholipase/Carboxylesterase n=1 Tax=Beijerinckia indica subsp. indica (strain ATCC 9039 / DSM 1715 / NCIMB 8712) TaxID=395963 RepID=B2IE75_BEII9|nr:prolyl oligopeptidase family serine peptidase [Beijerinckia indica]ACB94099.1 phospholipase/Carboxylesterase [Beijerinckia indica subsp. indica ATCC 9039]